MKKKKIWGYVIVVFGCLTLLIIIITKVLDRFIEPMRTRIALGITIGIIILIVIGCGLIHSAQGDEINKSLQ